MAALFPALKIRTDLASMDHRLARMRPGNFAMIIETERLLLRPIDPDRDFDHWYRTNSDPETVRYLGTKPMNRAEAWRSMAMVLGHWAIRGFGFFSVELRPFQ